MSAPLETLSLAPLTLPSPAADLASVILQMKAFGLGSPQDFPFLDAPDARLLNDGYRLLQELGAVDGERRITRIGRQMELRLLLRAL